MGSFHELLLPRELREAESFLRQADLDMPEGVTFALGVYEDNALIGTGFLAGSTLCGICVSPTHRSEGLAAAIVDRLLRHGRESGLDKMLLFTTPIEAPKFLDLGFALVAQTREASFLEWGKPDCADWLTMTRTALGDDIPGALVMNANPFTLGHRHLVEQALTRCPRVAVFVVEEDASTFSFAVRLALVRAGLADLPNALVVPGGPYMVSRASFPAYFTGRSAHGRVHAELDATVFATRIAPALGIRSRFVGTEPLCEVTAAYNAALHAILPAHGVDCIEIPRLEVNNAPVSASTVRALLRDHKISYERLAGLLPPATLHYLQSPEAEPVLRSLRALTGRH